MNLARAMTQMGRQLIKLSWLELPHKTREARSERSLASARLAVLEPAGHELGFKVGTRTRGIKPNKMSQVLPELQEAVRRLRLKMLPLRKD